MGKFLKWWLILMVVSMVLSALVKIGAMTYEYFTGVNLLNDMTGYYVNDRAQLYLEDSDVEGELPTGKMKSEDTNYRVVLTDLIGDTEAEGYFQAIGDEEKVPFKAELINQELRILSNYADTNKVRQGIYLKFQYKPVLDGEWYGKYGERLVLEEDDNEQLQGFYFNSANQKSVVQIERNGFDLFVDMKNDQRLHNVKGTWSTGRNSFGYGDSLSINFPQGRVDLLRSKSDFNQGYGRIPGGFYQNDKIKLTLYNHKGGYYTGVLESASLDFGQHEWVYDGNAKAAANRVKGQADQAICEEQERLKKEERKKQRELNQIYRNKDSSYDPFGGIFFDVSRICSGSYYAGSTMGNSHQIKGYDSDKGTVIMAGNRVFKLFADAKEMYLVNSRTKEKLSKSIKPFVAGIYRGTETGGRTKALVLKTRKGDHWQGVMLDTDVGLTYPFNGRQSGNTITGEFYIAKEDEYVNAVLTGDFIYPSFTTGQRKMRHYPMVLDEYFDEQPLLGDELFVAANRLKEVGFMNQASYEQWLNKAIESGSEMATTKQGMVKHAKEAPKHPKVKAINPDVVYIPAGSFTMGCDDNHSDCRDREKPAHKVTLKSFHMMKHEVTVEQFRQFVTATGYRAISDRFNGCQGYYTSGEHTNKWRNKSQFNWQKHESKLKDKHPVSCVSFEDAQAFARWLSQKTGKTWRLPTEAEWEYAARGGKNWGTGLYRDKANLCKYVNHADRSSTFPKKKNSECDDGVSMGVNLVKSYQPNPWGLYDMLGNVWEYTQDCAYDNYKNAPVDGSAWSDKEHCVKRRIRGGSWGNGAIAQRVQNRAWQGEIGSMLSGFRLVRD